MQKTIPINGRAKRNGRGHVLVTGGAGFVGTSLAARLLDEGRRVVVLDSLARPAWSGTCAGSRLGTATASTQ
jgi:nucleoside-diphosphate-sugar epimerase